MDLGAFVQQGWMDHGGAPEAVFARLPDGIALVRDPGDAPKLAGLVVHVGGEHLGRWDAAIAVLDDLLRRDLPDDDARGVWRSIAALHRCAGRGRESAEAAERGRSGHPRPESDEVRILAVAASALAGQRRTTEAIAAFTRAVALAAYGPDASDPAARALAVTGNNLAAELEGHARTPDEDRLMLEAAEVARRYWAIAGTWLNVERAEYRLASVHVALGNRDRAAEHARACLALCDANDADAQERGYGEEMLARALALERA